MKHLIVIVAFGLAFTGSSCHKNTAAIVASKCIENTIENNKNNSDWHYESIDEYEYQGASVYLFNGDHTYADLASQVVNADCGTICYLGGFAGNTMCNGDNFTTKATFKRRLWTR